MSHVPPLFVLAHAGEGATWQSLVVTVAAGLVVLFVLAVTGRLTLEAPDDLTLPLAGVVIVSSLAPVASATLSDLVGWGLPVGVVLLGALVAAATTPLRLRPGSAATWSIAIVALAAGVVLNTPLSRALHPPPEFLPSSDDAELAFAAPPDGAQVEAGEVEVIVELQGGSVADLPPDAEPPDDPEELGRVALFVDGRRAQVEPEERCTPTSPCTRLTYDLELDPGDHTLFAELRNAEDLPLSPVVTARLELTAG